MFNSKVVNFNPNHDEEGKFAESNGINPNYKKELKEVIEKARNNPNERQKLVIGKVTKDLENKAKENGFDITDYSHDLDISGTRHAFKEHGQAKTEEPRGQIAITDDDFEKIPETIYSYDDIAFTGKNKIGRETITYKKSFDDGTILYVEEIRDKQKTLTINTMYKYKKADNPRTFVGNNNPLSNASIYIIPHIENNLTPFVKEHEEMKIENWNEQDHPRDEQGKFTDRNGGSSNIKQKYINDMKNTELSGLIRDYGENDDFVKEKIKEFEEQYKETEDYIKAVIKDEKERGSHLQYFKDKLNAVQKMRTEYKQQAKLEYDLYRELTKNNSVQNSLTDTILNAIVMFEC